MVYSKQSIILQESGRSQQLWTTKLMGVTSKQVFSKKGSCAPQVSWIIYTCHPEVGTLGFFGKSVGVLLEAET